MGQNTNSDFNVKTKQQHISTIRSESYPRNSVTNHIHHQPMGFKDQHQPMGFKNQHQPMGFKDQHQPMGLKEGAASAMRRYEQDKKLRSTFTPHQLSELKREFDQQRLVKVKQYLKIQQGKIGLCGA